MDEQNQELRVQLQEFRVEVAAKDAEIGALNQSLAIADGGVDAGWQAAGGDGAAGGGGGGAEAAELRAAKFEARYYELRQDYDELAEENWGLRQESEAAREEAEHLRLETQQDLTGRADAVREVEQLRAKLERMENVFVGDEYSAYTAGSPRGTAGYCPAPRPLRTRSAIAVLFPCSIARRENSSKHCVGCFSEGQRRPGSSNRPRAGRRGGRAGRWSSRLSTGGTGSGRLGRTRGTRPAGRAAAAAGAVGWTAWTRMGTSSTGRWGRGRRRAAGRRRCTISTGAAAAGTEQRRCREGLAGPGSTTRCRYTWRRLSWPGSRRGAGLPSDSRSGQAAAGRRRARTSRRPSAPQRSTLRRSRGGLPARRRRMAAAAAAAAGRCLGCSRPRCRTTPAPGDGHVVIMRILNDVYTVVQQNPRGNQRPQPRVRGQY